MIRRKKIIINSLLGLTFLIVCIVLIWLQRLHPLLKEKMIEDDQTEVVEQEQISNENMETAMEPDVSENIGDNISESAEDVQEIPDIQAALSQDTISLCDMYAEHGTTVIFKCFYEDAAAYRWEYYDMGKRDWCVIEDAQIEYDELYRQVSYIYMKASDENNGIMIRCHIFFDDTREDIIESAFLYVLDKTVRNVSAEDAFLNAEQYVNILSIPVNVEYEDGSNETITGLSGLHFLNITEQAEDESVSIMGNLTETVTMTVSENDYAFINLGEQEVRLRYRNDLEKKKTEFTAKYTGIDQNPPVISQVDFSDYEVSTVDEPVAVTVTITAEDDMTPYPLLQYAILPFGKEPKEKDWITNYHFTKEMNNNGAWIIYCRDQYGNVATYEKDIIVIDNKKPVILSVSLEKEGWQSANTIKVDASDALSLTYSFSCAETGEDSGFIDRNEYNISENGTWKVRVMDRAGNISETNIFVTEIDNQCPIIIGIQEVRE